MFQTAITPAPVDRETAIAALAAGHLAALALVPTLTDIPTSLNHAKQLAASVRGYARRDALGMLGPNGIEPAVRRCVDSARRIGFGWRERVL